MNFGDVKISFCIAVKLSFITAFCVMAAGLFSGIIQQLMNLVILQSWWSKHCTCYS